MGGGLASGRGEQVVEDELGLDVVPVLVVLEPGERDHDKPDAPAQGDRGLESGLAREKPLVFRLVDLVRRLGILDFADVDRLVRPVQHQVDLGVLAAPGVCGDLEAGDAERALDLADVLEAEALERQPVPVGDARRAERVEPESRVVLRAVPDERVVEERVVVDQLVDGPSRQPADGTVAAELMTRIGQKDLLSPSITLSNI